MSKISFVTRSLYVSEPDRETLTAPDNFSHQQAADKNKQAKSDLTLRVHADTQENATRDTMTGVQIHKNQTHTHITCH